MTEPQIRYDEPSDTLHVSSAPGEGATGIPSTELRPEKMRLRAA